MFMRIWNVAHALSANGKRAVNHERRKASNCERDLCKSMSGNKLSLTFKSRCDAARVRLIFN